MEPAIAFEPLDGGDLFAIGRFQGREAGPDRNVIQENRARAALPLSTPVLCTCKAQFFAQYLQYRTVGVAVHRPPCPLDRYIHISILVRQVEAGSLSPAAV